MSFLDDAIAAAKNRAIIKIANPRAVQTAEQQSVTVKQQVGQSTSQPASASATASTLGGGLLSRIPGGNKTLLIVAGVLTAYLVAKKMRFI